MKAIDMSLYTIKVLPVMEDEEHLGDYVIAICKEFPDLYHFDFDPKIAKACVKNKLIKRITSLANESYLLPFKGKEIINITLPNKA